MANIVETTVGKIKLSLVQGDITQQSTEAIVNAANSNLMGGGGVDGAIHRVGGPTIKEECGKIISRIGRLETGKAVITSGGNLQAKYVIHTVGPVWLGGKKDEAKLLASAYRESLRLAIAYKLKSVSFPAISTGAYGYPGGEAARISLLTTISFLKDNSVALEKVLFVLYDLYTYRVYCKVFEELTGQK